jgi:hypothetical protein
MIEWTDSRIDLLKKCVAQSMSASQAAAVIGGISRNGAIGKAQRLGLKFTSRYQPIPATAVSTAVSIPATAVSIFELTARTCRWPLWGPDTPAAQKLYCGAERLKPTGGSWDKMNACPPYCAHHCAVAIRPGRS